MEAVNRTVERAMTRLGAVGPGLTSAAFNAGLTRLTDSIKANHDEALNYQRQANNKTFTQKHGETLAERARRLTGAATDADLPEVHTALVNVPKAREYGVVQALISLSTKAYSTPS